MPLTVPVISMCAATGLVLPHRVPQYQVNAEVIANQYHPTSSRRQWIISIFVQKLLHSTLAREHHTDAPE